MLTDYPNFSIFIPCKLAIYEHNSNTILSKMNMSIILKAINSNKELYKEAVGLFNSMKSMMTFLAGD